MSKAMDHLNGHAPPASAVPLVEAQHRDLLLLRSMLTDQIEMCAWYNGRAIEERRRRKEAQRQHQLALAEMARLRRRLESMGHPTE